MATDRTRLLQRAKAIQSKYSQTRNQEEKKQLQIEYETIRRELSNLQERSARELTTPKQQGEADFLASLPKREVPETTLVRGSSHVVYVVPAILVIIATLGSGYYVWNEQQKRPAAVATSAIDRYVGTKAGVEQAEELIKTGDEKFAKAKGWLNDDENLIMEAREHYKTAWFLLVGEEWNPSEWQGDKWQPPGGGANNTGASNRAEPKVLYDSPASRPMLGSLKVKLAACEAEL